MGEVGERGEGGEAEARGEAEGLVVGEAVFRGRVHGPVVVLSVV